MATSWVFPILMSFMADLARGGSERRGRQGKTYRPGIFASTILTSRFLPLRFWHGAGGRRDRPGPGGVAGRPARPRPVPARPRRAGDRPREAPGKERRAGARAPRAVPRAVRHPRYPEAARPEGRAHPGPVDAR